MLLLAREGLLGWRDGMVSGFQGIDKNVVLGLLFVSYMGHLNASGARWSIRHLEVPRLKGFRRRRT